MGMCCIHGALQTSSCRFVPLLIAFDYLIGLILVYFREKDRQSGARSSFRSVGFPARAYCKTIEKTKPAFLPSKGEADKNRDAR